MPTRVPLSEPPRKPPRTNVLPLKTPLGVAYFPLRWLLGAYWDMRRAPIASLSYSGLIVGAASLSFSSIYENQSFYLFLPLGTLLVLMAPSFFCGFVTISRCLERNRSVSLKKALTEGPRNDWCYFVVGMIIMLLLVFWLPMALILLAVIVHVLASPLESLSWSALWSLELLPLILAGAVSGAAMAAIIFSMTVIASPLLLERPLDALSAMRLSVRSTKRNWPMMATWGLIIILLVGFGMTICYSALVLVMPLIGHASWHAYRDLVSS